MDKDCRTGPLVAILSPVGILQWSLSVSLKSMGIVPAYAGVILALVCNNGLILEMDSSCNIWFTIQLLNISKVGNLWS